MKTKILLFLLALLSVSLCWAAPVMSSDAHPRVALVLGGGGARGYAELGVLKVLSQAGVPVDLIVGTSIGSVVGSLYADNPSYDNVDSILMNAKKNEFLHLSPLHSLKGPFSGKSEQTFITKHLTVQDFSQLKIKFIAVATDLNTGNTVPITSGLIAPAVTASSALSPFFSPVVLNGSTLVDGSSSDPIAVDIAEQQHPKVIIAVDISEDLPTTMPDNLLAIFKRSNLIRAKTLAQLSEQGADVVIHPQVGPTGVFDNSQKQALEQAGVIAAQKALPQICVLLKKHHIANHCQQMA